MSSTESKPTEASTPASSSSSILTPSSESAAGTMSSAFPHVQLADATDDAQVVEKVEQLLSRQNLANDSYLVSKMKDDMYIPLEVLVSSPGLLAAFGGVTIELERLQRLLSASTLVSLSADKSLIKPNFSLHRHTVILRDLPASFTTEDIQKLLETSGVAAKVAQIRCEVSCWFVSFESQEEAAAALKSVRAQKINGVSVAARLKSESLLRSTSRARHSAAAAAAQASSSESSSTSSSPSPLPHHQGGAKAAGIPFYPYYAPWYSYPGGPAPHPDSHLPPHHSLGYPQHGQQLAPGGHPIHGAPVFDGSVGQHVQTSPRSSAGSSSASATSSRAHSHGGHPSAPGGGRSKGGPSSYGGVGGQRGSGSKPGSQGGVGVGGKRRTGGRPSAPGSGAGGKPEGYAPSASSPSSTTSTSSSGSQGAAGGQQRKGRVPRTGGPAGGRDGEYSHHPHHHHSGSSSSHPRAEQTAPKREAVPLTTQNFPPLSGSASAEKAPAASTWTKEGVTLVRAPPPQAAKPLAAPKPAAAPAAPVAAATLAASAVVETPVAAQQAVTSPIPSPSPAVQSPAAAVVTAPAAAAAPAPAPASTPVASTLAPATTSPAPAAVSTAPVAAPAATPSAAPVSAIPAPAPATPAAPVTGAAPTKPLWASIVAKKPTSVAQ